jgi:hypothetical protein
MNGGRRGRVSITKFWRGDYKVTGIVTVNGAPAERKVRLFEFPTLKLLEVTFSDATTGRYTFSNVALNPSGAATYGVMAVDHTGLYDPETKISLTPEAM